MINRVVELKQVNEDAANGLVFEKNVSIPTTVSNDPIRCNVYRPLREDVNEKFPVLVTYGPYGKDIFYGDFHPKSYSEVPEEHRSKYAAWETPEPVFWTKAGYAVVRADERGLGQSPGLLDTMSKGTSQCFVDVIEWAASQPWSSGKVGLLGISYYAGSQWRVAARKPKGLAAMIPWEGMSDYYRDRCRHGGIFSNKFIDFWWNRQVITNQYGRPGRAERKWGEDTLEGDLDPSELEQNCRDQNVENEQNRYLDDDYYASRDFSLEDIDVPLLSVANWGGISLHLRGNVQGYTWAGSKDKFLRFIVGRHDLPFYYQEEVAIQKSFLDAFLKGSDPDGWSRGMQPSVSICLRKGDVGFNNPFAEKTFGRRSENEWPLARTQYMTFNLLQDGGLSSEKSVDVETPLSYEALGSVDHPQLMQFQTAPFGLETEITGHIVARLNVSVTSAADSVLPERDIDLFLTLRHISPTGNEVFYTGSSGDNVPVTKGWLRVSLRKVNSEHYKHRPYLPYREYRAIDVQPVHDQVVYEVDVEMWPTNVVVEKGGRLVFEVSSGDTQGAGIFQHNNPVDRSREKFAGTNTIHLGPNKDNYVMLPVIPQQ